MKAQAILFVGRQRYSRKADIEGVVMKGRVFYAPVNFKVGVFMGFPKTVVGFHGGVL